MLASSPRLVKLFCLCRCFPPLCYILVLSPLFLRVGFKLSLTHFRFFEVLCAFICFIKSFKPSRMKSNMHFAYPLVEWDPMDESTWFLILLLPCWCLHYIWGGHLVQQEVYAHLRRFMVGNYSSFQEKSFHATRAPYSHYSLDDSSTICLCQSLILGRVGEYTYVVKAF